MHSIRLPATALIGKAPRLSMPRKLSLRVQEKEFDPKVVEGFLEAFRRGALEVPDIVV